MPDRNGEPFSDPRAYALLASVMEERQRIGVSKVVMREKQYHDDDGEELRKRIKAKQKGKLETVEEETPPAKVLDHGRLRASLERGARGTRSSTRRSARRAS